VESTLTAEEESDHAARTGIRCMAAEPLPSARRSLHDNPTDLDNRALQATRGGEGGLRGARFEKTALGQMLQSQTRPAGVSADARVWRGHRRVWRCKKSRKLMVLSPTPHSPQPCLALNPDLGECSQAAAKRVCYTLTTALRNHAHVNAQTNLQIAMSNFQQKEGVVTSIHSDANLLDARRLRVRNSNTDLDIPHLGAACPQKAADSDELVALGRLAQMLPVGWPCAVVQDGWFRARHMFDALVVAPHRQTIAR
jgi:hypothetical protein